MNKCYQCGRPALQGIKQEDGSIVPLCIDCTLKLHQMHVQRHKMLADAINFTADQANLIAGFPIAPKIQTSPMQVLHTGDTTVHNINVGGNVGVLNTGNIQTVDTAIGCLEDSGDGDTASALKALAEAVLANAELANEAKDELLELLSLVSLEATRPKQQRKAKAIGPVVDRIAAIFGGLSGLSQLWTQYGPTIYAHFS